MLRPHRTNHTRRVPRLPEILEARCLLAANVVINEIHYDPPDKTQSAEFIELLNDSDENIDLSGWYFSSGVDYLFPQGTRLSPRDYLVVAQDPSVVRDLFQTEAIGPWSGELRNSGERIVLRDATDGVIDEVDYQRGFPWPTVGDAPGHSIELIHPDLPNDLGGNWRRAGSADATPLVVSSGETWSYFPGTREASSSRSAWRRVEFDDSSWSQGVAPLGYGDSHVETQLDMRGNYSTLYLRKTIDIDDVRSIRNLTLQAQYDDGFNLWINGKHLVQSNVASVSPRFDATATSALENLDFVDFALGDPADYLVDGPNVIAVQLQNSSLANSSDAWFDARLLAGVAGNHSAGMANTVLSDNAPPVARQVRHGEGERMSGADVVITTKVTDPDEVAEVTLEYQVVTPGDYFGRYLKANPDGTPVLDPRYDDPAEWTTLVMNDGGQGVDQQPGDDVYSVVIPGNVNQHRHLIRYRIHVMDSLGAGVRLPYADDPQHNFAYFVYGGVPDWTGASRPGRTDTVTYSGEQLSSLATYHLLTTEQSHTDSQHIPDATTSSYAGSEYLWPGTMVYDGQVYDNIRYRARGGVWRYAMGKNMWKFDFNRGHGFQAKDNYGAEYGEQWDKLNFSAIIQQGDYLHRGEQGLFESVGFKLFDLAGVESPNTHYTHFRLITSEDENGVDQYSGDFQGLYLSIEQPDGHFLDQHGLPDGNLYKIEGHQGSANNQGPDQAADGSDVRTFINGYRNSNPTAEWWQENLDLDRYFSYRTIVEGIHHYDIAGGKNYFYYHNPDTGKFQVHPWDLDLTWADNMYGTGEHDFAAKVARNPAFRVDYENRVRELRDLLFNQEQTGLLIDEFAAMVHTVGEASWVDADRAMWDFNPILRSSLTNSSKSGHGRYYEQSTTGDFAGMVQLMKDYVDDRGARLDRLNRTEDDIPETPTLVYTGLPDFPTDGLSFQTSEFKDPQGSESFAGMQWRISEITDPRDPQFGTVPPKYEISSIWESDVVDSFDANLTVETQLVPETLYRVRVRMQDADGHWSHWSDPIQFTTAIAPPLDLSNAIRVSEIHYHPADPTVEEQQAGFVDANEFEFVELLNIGQQAVDLTGMAFRRVDVNGTDEGIDFEFAGGALGALAPGDRLLVVENLEAFEFRYGKGFPIAGQWRGKLSNGGERLTLVRNDTTVLEFSYDNRWHPSADGQGMSLELVDPFAIENFPLGVQTSWTPSQRIGGSPGAGRMLGDFNSDLLVDHQDVDAIFAALSGGASQVVFDLNQDRVVNPQDADYLIDRTSKLAGVPEKKHRRNVGVRGGLGAVPK